VAVRVEIDTDAKLQSWEWRLQRTAWVFWGILLIAAGLGLLGPGTLSATRRTTSAHDLTASYDRFLHYHTRTTLRLDVVGTSAAEFGVWLSHDLVDAIHISRIEPAPLQTTHERDGVHYLFAKGKQAEDAEVVFHLDYERIGLVRGVIGRPGGGELSTWQFIYP
jgi:hypothetical protein